MKLEVLVIQARYAKETLEVVLGLVQFGECLGDIIGFYYVLDMIGKKEVERQNGS